DDVGRVAHRSGPTPPPSENVTLGGHHPRSSYWWWGPEECSWLLVGGPNDISLSPTDQLKRQNLLLEYGDYVARIWLCLDMASKSLRPRFRSRVVEFRDKLTRESNDSSSEMKKWIPQLKRCVKYLQEEGLDIDLEMAKLAILVYSKRNLLCHVGIGDAAASSSAALEGAIEAAQHRLPEVLPEDQLRNLSTWRRILAFYGSSEDVFFKRPGARSGRRRRGEDDQRRAFEERDFEDRLEAAFRTVNERIPLTFRPVLGEPGTKRSVSDPFEYFSRKKRAF
ncbi:hypothetical protein AbraCBS73388_011221, partial [Aspergillus brasiliensis]